jgi:hypothetical protein
MTPEEEKRINDRFERIEENLEKVSISLVRMETNFARMQANVEAFFSLMTGAFDRLEKILERHMSDGHGNEEEER